MWHLTTTQFEVYLHRYEALQMFIIGVRDKLMKTAKKKLMVFWLPFDLEYGGNFKGGFSDPAMQSGG